MRLRSWLLVLACIAPGVSCTDPERSDVLGPELPGDLSETETDAADDPAATRFTLIRAGYAHTCALDAEGAAYCWGSNVDGKLGDGTSVDRSVPTPVAGGHTFVSIGVGEAHTCGLRADGAAYCWGANMRGQLGDGNAPPPPERFGPVEFEPLPTPVAGGHAFASLAVGLFHACALAEDGTAWCWGANETGQLGNRSFADADVPSPVGGDLRFASLEAGGPTCGFALDGRLYCWGRDPADCECDVVPMPAAADVALEATSVALHVCGLTAGGAAYCWGENVSGQLGDGSNMNRPEPTAVAGGHAFASISAALSSTCALEATGDAYCWGSNPFGQIGDGTTGPDVRAPAAVSGGIRYASISAGRLHTCALDAAGFAYCWGWNYFGQLGDGTTEHRPVPGGVVLESGPEMVASRAGARDPTG